MVWSDPSDEGVNRGELSGAIAAVKAAWASRPGPTWRSGPRVGIAAATSCPPFRRPAHRGSNSNPAASPSFDEGSTDASLSDNGSPFRWHRGTRTPRSALSGATSESKAYAGIAEGPRDPAVGRPSLSDDHRTPNHAENERKSLVDHLWCGVGRLKLTHREPGGPSLPHGMHHSAGAVGISVSTGRDATTGSLPDDQPGGNPPIVAPIPGTSWPDHPETPRQATFFFARLSPFRMHSPPLRRVGQLWLGCPSRGTEL